MTAKSILVVEDDAPLLNLLTSTLEHAGYEVRAANTAQSAMESLAREPVSLMLLDLGLPDMDGKEVLGRLRRVAATPVIVISARTSGQETIDTLDLGANDYVTKPFVMNELLARIRVALRRPMIQCPPHQVDASDQVTVNFATRTATVNGGRVRLSRKEAQCLMLIADAKGEPVPQSALMEALWGKNARDGSTNLRVLIWQIRQKIEADPTVPQTLLVDSGNGYRLNNVYFTG